jgi:outer membrane protein OmpA-like peptidoglycan-associated protein
LFSALLVFASVGYLIAQVDVARRTTAITYPLDETVNVQFRGTTRFPRMRGEARVRRTARSGSRIELSVDNMPRPFELGAGYATYVVWAISPTGQVDNLGEIKRSGLFFIDSKITVTTPLQTFALIITAEPHFLVTRPSQQIMLENLPPVGTRGQNVGVTTAVSYFGNASDYFRDPRTPEIAEIDFSRTPPALLQAKQAIALARFAGAERDSATELAEAETLMQNAENSWRAGRDNDTVDIAARKAIAAAVRAESLAFERRQARERRNEQTRRDAEIRQAENRFSDAQQQIDELRAELQREIRNRELAERDSMTLSGQLKELRDENGRLREELGRMRLESDNMRARLTAAETENASLKQERERDIRADRLRSQESQLISALKAFGSVSKTDRGIVVTLPENWWAGIRSTDLVAAAKGKLSSLGELLVNNPDYRVAVESHTDNFGTPEQIQQVTDRRSFAIADTLASAGVEEGRIMAKGFGASLPVAPNTTTANRSRNRRTQLVLTLSPGS